MGFSLDDLNPFSGDGIFSGGAGDRGRAASNSKKARQEWEEFQKRYQSGEFDPGELGMTYDQTSTAPGQFHAYDPGQLQQANTARYLDPAKASELGIRTGTAAMDDGGSWWAGDESAFSGMEPSAWDSYGSEFGNLGPSAYGDLAYDEQALSGLDQAGDYYGGLMTSGSDPIAEADFQRRTAAAESSRRANTDAALAQLEQRGQGNANAGLLAELSNQQASVSDQYLAGLDANAMAAARRDSAAGSMADVSQARGAGMLAADTARAGGMDSFAQNRAAGMDAAGASRAAGQDAYGMGRAQGQDAFTGAQNTGLDSFAQNRMQMVDDWNRGMIDDYYGNAEFNAGQQQHSNDRNMDRQWGASDANTDMYNNAQYYNSVTRPGQQFNQGMAVTGGVSNANMGVANTYGQNAQGSAEGSFKLFDTAINAGGAAAKKAGV